VDCPKTILKQARVEHLYARLNGELRNDDGEVLIEQSSVQAIQFINMLSIVGYSGILPIMFYFQFELTWAHLCSFIFYLLYILLQQSVGFHKVLHERRFLERVWTKLRDSASPLYVNSSASSEITKAEIETI
jgi:hypothetical protein